MAALKGDPSRRDAKHDDTDASPLARVMREFKELVLSFETGLLRSLEDADAGSAPGRKGWRREDIRHEACRLAIAELGSKYTRKQIRRSLNVAESQGKLVEEQLHATVDNVAVTDDEELRSIHNGYFRLYSTELFDMLGQPTDLRFGTLRFHRHSSDPVPASCDLGYISAREQQPAWISVELALNSSFFVADSLETLPYHTFKMPQAPSLQNRGILSRKPEDNGAFPEYDSWLLFTFLGNGCLKLEVPIEMCADVYGGPLIGRENEEVLFWGVFVEDDGP
ncbi:hypothetical protein BU26DRAFT_153921 [Trematosphaeria pertusa]|uniref:Uncharacterized protein n=1 Tax=Trematosphaeria pertusa TaxID=390896 RepID=A0A6A6IXQ2_9PLEO|nr:uncharacterized protein BU26DRAFT_153921 [Trematosphaeria pertusa]KAF2255321.1 hypothetical protein BU26DRAFT_153921 [Trematosphaeria pertusa]